MKTKREILNSSLILILLILSLWALSRDPFCSCGEFKFWVADSDSSHTSQHLFDPYSFSHFQHGLIFFCLFFFLKKPRLEFAVALEALWEFAENTPLVIDRYRSATAALGYEGDSILNSSFDVVSCALGFYFARKLPWKLSLAAYLLIELLMLIIYKDSLILNVIMLVYPLDIIREWQLK